MDLASAIKNAARVAVSESLAALARADEARATLVEAVRTGADLASPDDLRRLSTQIDALSRATGDLHL